MNYVEPIRDEELVAGIANYLKKSNERDYVMFMTGLYTGLRISDILKLKIGDVANKDYINIREMKTGKQKIIEINLKLKPLYKNYCHNKDYEEYLISSQQNCFKAISRVRAYMILREVAKKFGIENIGTHSMRKTFGYHFYQKEKDAQTLKEIFNHSSESVTLRYIGINQEIMNKKMRNFSIF